ncbi:MAG TPA: AI-2E family transporter [Novosphingobium sp.]|nr:AI-2E family transporter [Novosphingobium sp.]
MIAGEAPATGPSRLFLPALVVVATLAFIWLVAPFSGAILWAVIVSVLFAPLNARLLAAMPRRRNGAALVTLLVIVAVLVVPAMLLGMALLKELAALYARMGSDTFDLGQLFARLLGHLPDWARGWLADIGLNDVGALRGRLNQGVASSFDTVLAKVLNWGQGAFGFFLALGVMLYLAFFLLRDGVALAARVEQALPLPAGQRRLLGEKFVAVIRATIKGSIVIAILQGLVGGLAFWALGLPGAVLWGVAMGVFSLFPAIGTGLVWVPAALYLLATGAYWQGGILFALGFFIISSIDNVVRPILVGRDTQMPDYLVLIATLGGFEVMGVNGFVVGPVIAALFLAIWDIYAGTAAQADTQAQSAL